uniref:Uncharacterized protein n=1 Tax=Neobodo designis TaxID=312471 RepID=A0A7S1L0A7_NEODS|mmetsp:Transcript_12346/g.38415  ORF Transcript_12346/g.38415 Transcript_12346/m.38415 type:complete len:472 (+) Transcript_12346:43-1458(+)|eukprot:CAMPEP_0174829056 /NCGR_PEP_ID=MMETSP1114-20130205/1699_1 /TAXON_ID=312471 /ORGANISM="Neobodo designis, Strain CCAP 1951/1" /LENGTH=471 /DNA_ID=CAMNT_0016062795 /DNA_START=44 /DNA_END=1459 /DNA_ORIENTATION=-
MRRTAVRAKFRLKDDLMYVHEAGHTASTGFSPPYQRWQWKQNELFRSVFEDQTSHLRKVYAKQYYEAYISNADEYISKYNVTKAATLASWEAEMEAQEAKRREDFQRHEGRKMLRNKHLDLLREKRERQFFHWYERASERLQYADETFKFVTRENIDAHLDAELDKYVVGDTPEETRAKHFPLNFIGQMPYLEDGDLNVVAAPNARAAGNYNDWAKGRPAGSQPIGVFEPTPLEGAASADVASEAPISGAVRSLDDVEAEVASRAVDDMLAEEERGATPTVETIDPIADGDEAERKGAIRASIERAQHDLPDANWVDRRPDTTVTDRSPTIAETKSAVADRKRRAAASAKKRQRRERGGSRAQQRIEAQQQKNLESLGISKPGDAAGAASAIDETDPTAVDSKAARRAEARRRREEMRRIDDSKLAEAQNYAVSKGQRAVSQALKDRDETGAQKEGQGPKGGSRKPRDEDF